MIVPEDSQENVVLAEISRRRLLTRGIGLLGTAITAILGIPAIGYFLSPALKRVKEAFWVPLGAVKKVQIGVPTLFKAKIETREGWIRSEKEESVYIVTDDREHFTALSNVCTHLGCRVHWDSEKNSFFCPCHGGFFDRDGNVLAGPPPRPLDRFETKVEKGKIYIKAG